MTQGIAIHLAQAPYPGLRPFQREEADIFFGRERQTDELLLRLSKNHFLPVIGPSGCGKSSLVRAGLLASIESGFIADAGGRWRTLAIMPRDRPIEELATVLAAVAPESSEARNFKALQAVLRSGPRGLIEALKECESTPRENVLLLVDQFEEIFRFREQRWVGDSSNDSNVQSQRRKDEADTFVTLLLETVKEEAAYIVLTMRSDFLRDCSAFTGLPEAFNKSIYLTPRLDRDEIQAAIEEPARVFGGSLMPELVRQLINDADNKQDQLPLMQHVLMRMWSKASSERPGKPPVLTLADYAAVGEISRALNQDAEAAFENELTPQQQKIAEAMFRSLCVRGSSDRDTRAPGRLDDIARLAGVKWQDVAPVVEVFRATGRHFLTPHTGDLHPDTVLDLSHESLIRNWRRLQDWLEDEAHAAESYQRLERDAREWKAGGDVLSPVRLAVVNAWEKRFQPTDTWAQRYGGNFELAMDFLEASRAQRKEEARKAKTAANQKKLNRRLALALVVAVILIGWAVYQTMRANQFLGQAMMFRAVAELSSDKPLSALPLSASAPKYDNQIDPLTTLSDFPFPHIHYSRQICHSAEVRALAIHPMGTLLAAALGDGSVDLVNPLTGAIEHKLSLAKSATSESQELQDNLLDSGSVQLAFSPQGDRLFCADGSDELRIWSVPDGKFLESKLSHGAITGFALARSGLIALGLNDGTLEILLNGQKVDSSKYRGPDSPLRSLAFSPDERLLAGVIDNRLFLWRIENSKTELLGVESASQFPTAVSAVAFSPDGATLVLSTPERRVSLWNLPDPKPKGAQAETPAAASPDGKSVNKASTLRLNLFTQVPQMREDFDPRIYAQAVGKVMNYAGTVPVAVDPDGAWVYWLAGGRYLGAWSWTNRTVREFVKTHGRTATSIAVSPSGLWLATGGTDAIGKGTTRIWLLETEELTARKAKSSLPPIRALSVDNNGQIVAIGKDDFGMRIWRDNAVHEFAPSDVGDDDEPKYFSDDGTQLAVASNQEIRIFDVATQRETATIDIPDTIYRYAFNGRVFALGEHSTFVALWDTKTGARIGDFHAAKSEIADIMFGRQLVAVAADKSQIAIWDLRDPVHAQKGVTMATDTTPIRFIAFAPAENVLAAACNDQTVRLFDAKSGRQAASITFTNSIPSSIAFTTDGTLIAIGLENGTIQIWDCARAKKIGEVSGWDCKDIKLAFTPNSELVAAMNNQTIGVWSRTGTLIRTVRGKDWRPRDPDDAMRLSGLVLDGFDVRPLTLKEEQRLKIDVSTPLKNVELAEFRSAYWTTARNFADLESALKRNSNVTASDVDGADSLLPWLKRYAEAPESDAFLLASAERARNKHKNQLADIYGRLGTEALLGGDYARAIFVFDEILKFIPVSRAPHYRAGRGFARHSDGDEAGAAEDFEAYKQKAKAADMRSWEALLSRRDLTPSQALIANSFLTWLKPDYAAGYQSKAMANFLLKRYNDALADVNEALRLQSAEPSNPGAPETARLLLLRGRILDAQGFPDSRKDWQQVAEGPATDEYTRACAQMLLGKFDAALPYFKEQLRKYPRSSTPQYQLACFFGLRAASHGPEGESQRADDLKTAFEALQKGVQLGSPKLSKFKTWATDLQCLDNDPRLNALLSQEEEATAESQ